MFVIIGAIIVLGGVIGGYLMEHGNLHVLIQPAELVIIGGAAVGSFLISAPQKVVKLVVKGFSSVLGSEKTNKSFYMELFALLYALFRKTKKEGLLAIESDLQNPNESALFQEHKTIISHKQVFEFICDSFRIICSSNIATHTLDGMLDLDIETHHNEAMLAPASITKIADSLPGLGIVAAVLGVVLTMGKIDQPPKVLGECIGAALVGTFLGILMCYGFVGPMGTKLEHLANEEQTMLNVIKTALVTFLENMNPELALEAGRKAIPASDRPGAIELEDAAKEWKKQK